MSTRYLRPYPLTAAACLALSTFEGCVSGNPPAGEGGLGGEAGSTQEVAEQDLESARAEVRQLAEANLGCADNSDCAALPFGSKPCGGPWEYLAYSQSGESVDDLVDAGSDLAKQERAYNMKFEVQSDCSLVQEPATECLADQCVAMESK